MRLAINLVLLFVMALCIWEGHKRGVIRSLLGLTAIILALIFSNMAASALSEELVPAVNPFVSGYVDSESTIAEVLEALGYGQSDRSLEDILAEDSSLRYDYAYECMRQTGFFSEVSEDLAADAVNYANKNDLSMTDAVITVVSNALAYVICITVLFVMIIVLMSALLDLLNLNIRLPNAEILDEVAGSAIGFVKGFLICILLSWLIGFLGLLTGRTTADKCALLKFFQAFRFVTRTLI